METMMQGLVIIGGLTFSLAASLLIEELIFGRIVRMVFARRPSSSQLESRTESSSQFPVLSSWTTTSRKDRPSKGSESQ